MKLSLLVLSLGLVFFVRGQSKLESEIRKSLSDSLPPTKIRLYEVHTCNCPSEGRKDVEIAFHTDVDFEADKNQQFRDIALIISAHVCNHILIHHPGYDCITISIMIDGTKNKKSLVFYYLGGKVLLDDNGKIVENTVKA